MNKRSIILVVVLLAALGLGGLVWAEREGRVVATRAIGVRAPQPEQAEKQELMQHRRELTGRAREIRRELGGLRDGQDDEARELQAQLREISQQIQRIERELGGPERADFRYAAPDRPEAEAHKRELMQHRRELQQRAREIERKLEELGDREEAGELREELEGIRERIRDIDNLLRGPERDRPRGIEPEGPWPIEPPRGPREGPQRPELRRIWLRLDRLESEIRQLREEVMRLEGRFWVQPVSRDRVRRPEQRERERPRDREVRRERREGDRPTDREVRREREERREGDRPRDREVPRERDERGERQERREREEAERRGDTE